LPHLYLLLDYRYRDSDGIIGFERPVPPEIVDSHANDVSDSVEYPSTSSLWVNEACVLSAGNHAVVRRCSRLPVIEVQWVWIELLCERDEFLSIHRPFFEGPVHSHLEIFVV
jgi:hypothetical protein